jgi:hypothetical protein
LSPTRFDRCPVDGSLRARRCRRRWIPGNRAMGIRSTCHYAVPDGHGRRMTEMHHSWDRRQSVNGHRVLPADAARIVDNWDTLGMRGTGSHDIAIEDLFVPERHAWRMSPMATAAHRSLRRPPTR